MAHDGAFLRRPDAFLRRPVASDRPIRREPARKHVVSKALCRAHRRSIVTQDAKPLVCKMLSGNRPVHAAGGNLEAVAVRSNALRVVNVLRIGFHSG
jgi:hypothetical protein